MRERRQVALGPLLLERTSDSAVNPRQAGSRRAVVERLPDQRVREAV